jgi:hypothetical protein
MMPSGFADLCARRDETSGKWQVYCGSHMRASRSMRPIDLSARRRDNLQARLRARLRIKAAGSPYRAGRSAQRLKIKSPVAPAVRRLEEDDWT